MKNRERMKQNKILSQESSVFETLHAPDSCCKTVLKHCGILAHPNNLFEHGCLQKIMDLLEENIVLLVAAGLVVMIVQFMALISALYLLNRLRRKVIWEWNKGLSKAQRKRIYSPARI